MAFEWLADGLAGLGIPQPRRAVPRRGDDALAVGAERRAIHTILVPIDNQALAQIAQGSIELQFRLRDIGSCNSGRAIRQRLKGEQQRCRGIALRAFSAGKTSQELRLHRLRLFELAVSTFLLCCDAAFGFLGAVLSSDAVTMRLPTGLNVALYTKPPEKQRAVTMRLPSGLNAALLTKSAWPLSGSPICLPVAASHSARRVVPRRGDDALACRAERRAIHRRAVQRP